MITAEKVGIESSIGFETVYNMEMSIKPNEHGKLILQDSYVYHENGVCEVIVTALSGSWPWS